MIAESAVPDWNSWNNQGCGLAVFNLGAVNQLSMFVLRVDQPGDAQANLGTYRVGHRLTDQGTISGDWTDWIDIPDWGSTVNQGTDLAVADFGAGSIGLVVLQVSHQDGQANVARLRVGRDLDAAGVVTGGWTPWVPVPDWTSWRNQGAAVAVTNLGVAGSVDLVVLQVDAFRGDNPTLNNKAAYRVATGLTRDAGITGWGPWQQVDWNADDSISAGVAVTNLDLTGPGRQVVVFQLADRPGPNVGRYRIGWGIDALGRAAEGWSPWAQIPDWDSWEDQGGSLTLATFAPGQRPKAVVLHVDNPPGLNEARFFVSDLVVDLDDAATLGVWRLLPYYSDVLAVHAALLHTGEVLFFAGSGNNYFRRDAPGFGGSAAGLYTSVLWDVQGGTFTHFDALARIGGGVFDFFCCGHCFLPDGEVLVIGGTDQYDVTIDGDDYKKIQGRGFTGIPDTAVFDPDARTWTTANPMRHGRWYPTAMRLADGQVIAMAGLDAAGDAAGTIEGTTQPEAQPWEDLREFGLPMYPHVFPLPDGQVFHTGGRMDTAGDAVPMVFDPLTLAQATTVDGLRDAGRCNQSASVVLPPAQNNRFMLLGGGADQEDGEVRERATDRVDLFEVTGAVAVRSDGNSMTHERMHVNAVLLPDSTVLATGGAAFHEATADPTGINPNTANEIFPAEIYQPITGSWTSTAAATVARLYHSVALLLPDGRVVTASGNPDKGHQIPWLPPADANEEMRLEIFSPPYLFPPHQRPTITNAPDKISLGKPFLVTVEAGAQPTTASLLRPGLTTHSFNSEQRLLELSLETVNAATCRLTLTADPATAPEGWYMLFVLTADGVPSTAAWTHLTHTP